MRFYIIFTAVAIIFSTLGNFSPPPSAVDAYSDFPTPTVVIDAGHGGEDGGACTYGGLPEKTLNLLISSDLFSFLSAAGIKTVMTRTEDVMLYDKNSDYKGHKKSMDLAERLKIARNTNEGILVSIHMNAFPEPEYGGLQVYYSVNSEGSSKLASAVQNINRDLLDPDNGRKTKASGKNIYLLDRYEGTGILIECGFLSNPIDKACLNNESYRKKLAAVIFFSIVQYLSEGGR